MTTQTYTFKNANINATLTIEADVAPLAVMRAEAALANTGGWTFDGMPIDEWLALARQMFAPA
jgi:hypothetical protein